MDADALTGSDLVLVRLFGDWIYGDGTTVTTLALFISIMAVGGIILYTIIVHYIAIIGLVKSAKSGSAMSSGWHPAWMPIRLVFALMLVLPLTVGAGWSLGQHGLLWIAGFGSKLADWSIVNLVEANLLNRYFKDENFQVRLTSGKSLKFVQASLVAASCLDAKKELDNPKLLSNGPEYDAWLSDAVKKCGLDYDLYFSGALYSDDAFTQQGDDYSSLPWATERDKLRKQQIAIANNVVKKQNRLWFKIITNFYKNYFKGMALSADSYKSPDKQKYEALWNLITSYHYSVNNKLKLALAGSYTSFATIYANDVKNKGWMMFFSLQRDTAQQSQVTQAIVNSIADKMTPTPKLREAIAINDQMIALQMAKVEEENKKAFDGFIDALGKGWDYVSEVIGEMTDKAVAFIKEHVVSWTGLKPIFEAAEGKKDPLVGLYESGQTLMGRGLAFMGAGGTGKLVGYASKFTPARLTGAVIGILGDASIYIGGLMFILGLGFYVLSLVPFIYGVGAIMRWLVYVVESLFAMPFWAAAHAAPEGDSHTSRLSQKGYNNLLFIALFPIMAIAGFIAAIGISNVGYQLSLNLASLTIMGDGGPMGWMQPVNWIIYLLTALLLSWVVIMSSYQLVDTVPTAVLNWISTAEPGLNPFSNNLSSKITGPFTGYGARNVRQSIAKSRGAAGRRVMGKLGSTVGRGPKTVKGT